MRPYYEHAGITIYHGDCRDVLPLLPSDGFDLTLADPPYGIGKADWDGDFPLWWMPEAARLAPNLGLMPGVWNLLRCPQAVGRLRYRWTLAAHLSNGMTRGAIGFGNWIPCLVYSAEDPPAWCAAFADWCGARGVSKADLDRAAGTSDMGGWWVSRLPHRAAIPTAGQWAKLRAAFAPPPSFDAMVRAGAWASDGDCRAVSVGAEPKGRHPCPKPLPAVRWLLSRLPGSSVVDPFMGSGTTLRAAKDLGRRAVGVEIEERYCAAAVKRLAQEVLPFAATEAP